jgi:hypothetical protein
MIFRLRFMAIAVAIAFVAGSVSGGLGVWKLWGYSDLTAKNRSLMQQIKNVASALDLGAKIDDENAVIELSNREVTDAINRKATEQRSHDDPICIPAEWLRDINRLH